MAHLIDPLGCPFLRRKDPANPVYHRLFFSLSLRNELLNHMSIKIGTQSLISDVALGWFYVDCYSSWILMDWLLNEWLCGRDGNGQWLLRVDEPLTDSGHVPDARSRGWNFNDGHVFLLYLLLQLRRFRRFLKKNGMHYLSLDRIPWAISIFFSTVRRSTSELSALFMHCHYQTSWL